MLRRLTIWFLQRLGFDPRGLFSFYDGRRYRHGDPMKIARKLWSAQVVKEVTLGQYAPMPFESVESRQRIKSGVGTQIQQGYAEIEEAVRYAFDLKPFEKGGLSENECEQLLGRFEDYLGDVKKNGSKTPISADGTVDLAGNATNSGSDGGSTSTDNTFALPDTSDLDSLLKTTLP